MRCDDPEFDMREALRPVRALTLDAMPAGDLDEALGDLDLAITIAPGRKASRKDSGAWLWLGELDGIAWVPKIVSATIQSDALDNHSDLYLFENVRELTIHVTGSCFHEDALRDFQLAIVNLTQLSQLTIVLENQVPEYCLDWLHWPDLEYRIQTAMPNPPRKRSRPRGEDQGMNTQ